MSAEQWPTTHDGIATLNTPCAMPRCPHGAIFILKLRHMGAVQSLCLQHFLREVGLVSVRSWIAYLQSDPAWKDLREPIRCEHYLPIDRDCTKCGRVMTPKG